YCYYKNDAFFAAAFIHATSSFKLKDGSDRQLEGPIAEAKRAGFVTVQPNDVGVVIAAGDNALDHNIKGSALRSAVKKRYAPVIDQCKEEGSRVPKSLCMSQASR